MPVRKEYTAEFKAQAVRFVFEEIGADESRLAAVERLAPKLNVKPATLMNWVKVAAPGRPRPTPSPGSVEELRAQVAASRRTTVSSLERMRSCRTRRVSSGRCSTASQSGSRVRGRLSASRGRADMQGAARRPIRCPLCARPTGVRPPARRRSAQAVDRGDLRGELPGLWATQDQSGPGSRARHRRGQGPRQPPDG